MEHLTVLIKNDQLVPLWKDSDHVAEYHETASE